MKPKPIVITRTIHASSHAVFAAITDPELISAWSKQEGIVEQKAGGKMEFFDGWVKGKVLECKKDRVLAYTWLPSEWEGKWDESVVKFRLSNVKGGTKIVLRHSRVPSAAEVRSHAKGWHEFFLDPLEEYLMSR